MDNAHMKTWSECGRKNEQIEALQRACLRAAGKEKKLGEKEKNNKP